MIKEEKCEDCGCDKSDKSENKCMCKEPDRKDKIEDALILGDKEPTFEEKLKGALGL